MKENRVAPQVKDGLWHRAKNPSFCPGDPDSCKRSQVISCEECREKSIDCEVKA